MSDRQLRIICFAAAGYLFGSVLAWGAFGVYLVLTGRTAL